VIVSDRDLVELFGRLEQTVEPDPRFVDDVLRRVESALTATAVDSPDVKELDMAQFVETRQRRRWLLPVLGAAAAILVVVALLATRSSDNNRSQVNISPPPDPVAAYAAVLHDAYAPYYSALNQYFAACQLAITVIDFKACGQKIDVAVAAVNTFDASVSKLQPPAPLVDDQAKILSADPAILDILQRSKTAADAQDVQALQAINPTFQAAYTQSCDSLKHYNSITPGDDHLRTDMGPGCTD